MKKPLQLFNFTFSVYNYIQLLVCGPICAQIIWLFKQTLKIFFVCY